jgi:hypothetical protein
MALTHCFRALEKLQRVFFAGYLQQDYLVRQMQYEKIIHQKRTALVSAILRMRHLLSKKIDLGIVYPAIFSRINHLSEIIFSLNQLRFRVKEEAVFKICAVEMQGIAEVSGRLFNQLVKSRRKKNAFIPVDRLLDKIHDFETISNRTLQVVAAEPLVFLLFVQDLYALHDELNAVYPLWQIRKKNAAITIT